ncbi:hypothetical protein C1645_345253 [Glomus cerebriforme]|uniref:Uncharacterized protein n=1 Tax=Glomus cerebriforme TaxID=658196 RepID=A0A397SMN4_9GLOM|nr:hypothetical protein C1645_345253 [Glomus cerebriforme]
MSFPSVLNLFYIPLSITIAYILNFVINSPLSIWQNFPPRLPNSVYSSIFLTPFLLFISLTFEPIQTRKRFYTLLFLTLSVISIPISFHGGKYPLPLQFTFVFIAIYFGLKMLLFLKFNRTYLNQKKESSKNNKNGLRSSSSTTKSGKKNDKRTSNDKSYRKLEAGFISLSKQNCVSQQESMENHECQEVRSQKNRQNYEGFHPRDFRIVRSNIIVTPDLEFPVRSIVSPLTTSTFSLSS